MNLVRDDILPKWLPDLILFEDYKGNWQIYINCIYRYFKEDFIDNKTFFQKTPISVRYHPPYQEKGATFWHIISEGSQESERIPDLRRCERIRWLKTVIENANSTEVKAWQTIRPWKNQKQRRINFALNNFSYLVVIAETQRGFDLVTAYYIERNHRRKKLQEEFESFSGQKKEGSAV